MNTQITLDKTEEKLSKIELLLRKVLSLNDFNRQCFQATDYCEHIQIFPKHERYEKVIITYFVECIYTWHLNLRNTKQPHRPILFMNIVAERTLFIKIYVPSSIVQQDCWEITVQLGNDFSRHKYYFHNGMWVEVMCSFLSWGFLNMCVGLFILSFPLTS